MNDDSCLKISGPDYLARKNALFEARPDLRDAFVARANAIEDGHHGTDFSVPPSVIGGRVRRDLVRLLQEFEKGA